MCVNVKFASNGVGGGEEDFYGAGKVCLRGKPEA